MNTIKCIVIDDEQHAIEVLESFIAQSSNLELIASTTNPFKGVELIRELHPDLVFLDIHMDHLSGLEVKELIDKEILTVFCTASEEHAIKSYELSALDYLLKPVSHKRFLQAVDRVERVFSVRQPRWDDEAYIVVKVGQKGKYVKIEIKEIDYIEASKNYITITHGTQKSTSQGSISDMEGRLPGSHFLRVHRSFIVSIPKILALENGTLILRNSSNKIPVGQNYRSQLLELLNSKAVIRPPSEKD